MRGIAYNGMGKRSHPVRDAERRGESYVKVTCTLLEGKPNSIQVHTKDGRNVYIPRSVIYGPDEIKLDPSTMDEPVTFRVMQWKARELGL